MRWSIIRLIWLRDLRDQLRDRRTLFMIAVLPLLLYPVLGFVVLQFAFGFAQRPSTIGIVALDDSRDFPVRDPDSAGLSPVPGLAWLAATPISSDAWIAAAALAQAGHHRLDYPLLLRDGQFTTFDAALPAAESNVRMAQARLKIAWLPPADTEALAQRRVDVILRAPREFFAQLAGSTIAGSPSRPALQLLSRPNDDYSKQATQRLRPLLESWKNELRQVRLLRKGLNPDVIDPFDIQEPQVPLQRPETIVDLVVRMFPFMLVMWSLAGALYPAVDLCAGEKERGTMETLLITPAGRAEIVVGKFLTIWVFSAASALLNLVSMGMTTWQFSGELMPQGALPLAALWWCVVLSLPLSALFSAVSLAIGAYARSSKEGQHYLMPLFLVTMPLIFLTLAPGVELNPFYSLVPVTGVALLMQRLMTASALDQVPWLYFIPVLAPIALYSWLALRWAIEQFQREEVLFREAERVDVRLWLRHLLRDKEPTTTTGQAFFGFGIILALRWLAMGMGHHLSVTVYASIDLVAFVAAPVLFMTLVLNTEPRASLALRVPTGRELLLAAVLAVLLLPPIAGLAVTVFSTFENLSKLLEDRQPLVQSLRALIEGDSLSSGDVLPYFVAFALLPAVCEELVFRGFLLTGLQKRFRPRTAIFLCSFLFALFHMNVFQFLPAFFLGVVLGLLTVRGRSVLPAMFFHLLYNGALLLSVPIKRYLEPAPLLTWAPYVCGVFLAAALALLWWLYRKPYVEVARAERRNEA
ncbi:MAG: CPBP family glutamic-type intramembrane protease [Gemmataceae bacterium]|nr:CPBP family glutamic-type intramembrane protease [Gemmataceae bacterium]